jgi:heme/copper-type cytochrome/quinol oxidase subunit 2
VSGKATEILWALIPIAIVLATAIPAVRTILFAHR